MVGGRGGGMRQDKDNGGVGMREVEERDLVGIGRWQQRGGEREHVERGNRKVVSPGRRMVRGKK